MKNKKVEQLKSEISSVYILSTATKNWLLACINSAYAEGKLDGMQQIIDIDKKVKNEN